MELCSRGRQGLCLEILLAGITSGESFEIEDSEWSRITGEALPETPTIHEMAYNAVLALARFAKSGMKITDGPTLENRIATCRSCGMFDEKARFGLGKCNAHGCGCTSLKPYLASESCPLGKWSEALKKQPEPSI